MVENETIHDRIKQLIDTFGDGKNTVFASLIGVNEANVRGYKTSVMPKFDFLEKIARCFEIDLKWLLTGEGDMLISEESKLESNRIETQSIATPDPDIVMRLMDKLDEREKEIKELTEKLCAAEKELIRVEAKIEALSKPNENTPESEDCPPLLVDPFTSVSYGDYIEPSKLPVKQKSSKKSSGLKT